MRLFSQPLLVIVLGLSSACSGGRATVGTACKTTSDCASGLHCSASKKLCEVDGAVNDGSNPSGPSNETPTTPTIAIAASSTAPYIGTLVQLTATVTPSDATVSWEITKPDTSKDTSLPAAASVSFAPSAVGSYSVTATVTSAGLTATKTTTLVAKAATIGAFIAFDKAVDGDTYGYYAFSTDLSGFRRMDTPGEATPNGFVALTASRFAYAFLAADTMSYQLHIGPQVTTASLTFGAWATFDTDTCAFGAAGPAPTHGGGGGTACYQTVSGLDVSGDGNTLSFLVGRSTTLDVGTGGDLWVVNPNQTVPSTALVTLTDVGNIITSAAPSVDGQQIAVVQESGDGFTSGLGLIANRASPTITTGSFAGKIRYARPKPLPGGDILVVRTLMDAITSVPNGSSPEIALVRASTPFDTDHQNVVVGLDGVTGYTELQRNTSGPSDEAQCTAAKTAGALGVSSTQSMDYQLSADYRYAVVWQNSGLFTDCTALGGAPSGQARRVVVLDLQGNSATHLSLQDAGVSEIGAGGATDSRGITRAQFIADGQQVVIALSQNALTNLDQRADLYVVNTDGTNPHRVMRSGEAVATAGSAIGIVTFR